MGAIQLTSPCRLSASSIPLMVMVRSSPAALAAAVTGPVPAMAGQVICPANTPCDDEFGAALVRVDVVN